MASSEVAGKALLLKVDTEGNPERASRAAAFSNLVVLAGSLPSFSWLV
jgi:hypothetical protein